MWASDDEAQTLEIVLGDDIAGVEVHLLYGVLEACDVITRSVLIKNQAVGNITIEKAHAACLDMVYGDYDVIRFYGKHAMERNLERTHLGHGTLRFGAAEEPQATSTIRQLFSHSAILQKMQETAMVCFLYIVATSHVRQRRIRLTRHAF
mgnify:FL=1